MKKPAHRVLAVEDHPAVGELMRLALSRSLIQATIITSGEEALAHLTTETYDLILLDISLPGMSGIEVCRKLKADSRLRRIPVIFVSGESGIEYKREARLLGAVDFIEKPFVLLDFLSRVLGHLNMGMKGERQLHHSLAMPKP